MSIHPDDWPRVRAVFERALAVPASTRRDYVADACAEREDIRHEVERMLASHDQADHFLRVPAAITVADLAVATTLEGVQIGPYRLGARIGADGMGEVYAARDARLGRAVAVKVLPSHVADDVHARERFDREARAIAALNHPHICVLHDIGEATVPSAEPRADDRRTVTIRYLVMELLEGETLASRLTRGPLPIDEAIRYAVQVASALDRAHQVGIVHRDLKPGNIFLVPSDGTSPALDAKLLDFGIAKHRAEPARERALAGPSTTLESRISRPLGRYSVRCSTWRRNSSTEGRSMRVPTCSRSAPCCSRCSRDERRSRGPIAAR
jgi:serine/threonine protein kinase